MQTNNLTEQKNLETLKNFIKTDLSIKNDLLELAPNKSDNFDESSKINYIDKISQRGVTVRKYILNYLENYKNS